MENPKRQNRITILLIAALLFIAMFAFMRYSAKAQVSIDKYAEETIDELVALHSKSIYFKLSDDMNLLNNLSALLEEEKFDFSQAAESIRNVKIKHGFFQLAVVNIDRTSVTADNSEIKISFEDIEAQFNSRTGIYNLPTESPINGEFILSMSSPVYDENLDKVQYILVGLYTLEELQEYIEDSFDKNGNISVIDSSGDLIFSNQLIQSGVELRKKYISHLFDSIETEYSSEEFSSNLSKGIGDTFIYSYQGDEIYCKYIPLGIKDWFIAIHLKKDSIASRVDLYSKDSFIFLATLGICILSLAIYIYIINKRVRKKLYALAYYDELTDLPNKEYFRKEIDKILTNNSNMRFFCIVFDICNFKLINDRFGYAAGDRVLCVVADAGKQIIDLLPEGMAIFAKIHSDTFAVFLPANNILELDTKMQDFIEKINSYTGFIENYRIDLSLGRYVTQPNDTSAIALERAFSAHAHSKRVTPNEFVNFDDNFINRLHTRADILNLFNSAIENDEFKVYFQPQYSATSKKIIGAEILVRWIKDGSIKYTPDVFIPVLEEAGRISKLDSYLREKLCILIRGWIDAGLSLPHFSVNVSRVELIQNDFVNNLKQLLEKYDIPPSMIHIEITETAYVSEQDYLIKKIIELKSHGFLVEMDDFGSGYSSLNVLKDLPIDIVKLDIKFITISDITPRSNNILNSIIQMARSINMITIAEGVETKEQVEYLEMIGCDYLQGYYFAAPMAEGEFIKILLKDNELGD